MSSINFWRNKRVFITGHTGFKGSWLCLWLHSLASEVSGYALKPPTEPNLFNLCKIDELMQSTISDIRDIDFLTRVMLREKPEIVIHMAAQPLVGEAYKIPVQTYDINIMGTVNLLESVRQCKTVKAVINVTTDKCYENKEWRRGYKEDDILGGYDPYSSSKACSEIITSAYRNSYFNFMDYNAHGVAVASARAGNVIGGGDWATNRLIPDCIKSIINGDKIVIRNPKSIRPWQYVLEPLRGYLMLAQKLYEEGPRYGEAWNFGPDESDAKSVEWIVKTLCSESGASYIIDKSHSQFHEANYLKLDCSKAKMKLGWTPKWDIDKAIDSIVEWTHAYRQGLNMQKICLKQIEDYSRNSSWGRQ